MANMFHTLDLWKVLLFALMMASSFGLTITASPSLATGAPLGRSQSLFTNCDGVSSFWCPVGTCYLGRDGFVGCCSVSSCAARTTCIPYTENVVQTCDQDSGGCVVCSRSDAPACVTISNVVDMRYIMYCDTANLLKTVSYTPLVTTGSMASTEPLVVAPVTKASSPSTTSSRVITSSTSRAQAAYFRNSSGFHRSTIIGISIGSILVVTAIIVLLLVLLRKIRKREAENEKSGLDISSSSDKNNTRVSTGCHVMSRQLSEPKEIMTTYVGDRNTGGFTVEAQSVLTPSKEHDRIHHELEDPEILPSIGVLPPSVTSQSCRIIKTGVLANATDRCTVSSSQLYQNYRQPSGRTVPELSSIRQVYPSGTFQASSSCQTFSTSAIDAAYVVSPLIGSVAATTPLMDQWGSGDNPSVGERTPDLSATVDGPVNWPNSHYLRSNSRPGSGHKLSRSLTNATGMGSNWISPEAAMAIGYSANEEEHYGEASPNE